MKRQVLFGVAAGLGVVLIATVFYTAVAKHDNKQAVCRPGCYFLKAGEAEAAEIYATCADRREQYMKVGTAANLSSGVQYLNERNFVLCDAPAVAPTGSLHCEICAEWHNTTQLWQWRGEGEIKTFPTVVCDRCK